VQRCLAILLLVLGLGPSMLVTMTARAEFPVRGYEIVGTDLIALNTALQEFRRRLPDKDVRDYEISVRFSEEETVFVFLHKDRPKDIYGQDPNYPILTVHVSPDGMKVLGWHFAR
jgi:hypothetical protein